MAEVFGLLPFGDLCLSGEGVSSVFNGAKGTPGGDIGDDDVVDGGSF